MVYHPMIDADTGEIDHLAVAERSQLRADGSFMVLGSVEQIRDVLCGAQQHNEHCKGYRWFQYMADAHKREQAAREEASKIIAARGLTNNSTISHYGRAEEGVRRSRF